MKLVERMFRLQNSTEMPRCSLTMVTGQGWGEEEIDAGMTTGCHD